MKESGGTIGRVAAHSPGATPFALPPLPYAEQALEPYISVRTLGLHYGKHHRAYVDSLNEAVAGTEFAHMGLAEVVQATAGNPGSLSVFNNAAQAWNHEFYWKSMRPHGGGAPSGGLKSRIDGAFGSLDEFQKTFIAAGASQFGSGWVWLVSDGSRLRIAKTPDADSPLTQGMRPLVVCDVWEHAYYLDYENRRADYIKVFLEKLANWDFAAENLG
jgi:Fe-Mn family superoxide dismutase